MIKWLLVLLLIAGYGLTVVIVNRTRCAKAESIRLIRLEHMPDAVGSEISVSTWNLGYAGLGAGSDFVMDGGTSMFPPSRAAVRENAAAILETAAGLDVDVTMFQEVARAGPLNLWVELNSALVRRLGDRQYWFRPDVASWGLPYPLRLSHGSVMASRVAARSAEIVPLPQEPEPMLGLLMRLYALQVMTIANADGGPDWVVINLHLSAFDDGGNLRRDQLNALFRYAEMKYREGNRVILGGDWNMVLKRTEFPSDTPEEFLFWIHDLPMDAVPENWTIAVDPAHPTVRTVHKPYVPGENYTMIIDGFIVSPNIEVVDVKTRGLGFVHSDHNPVIARFRGR